MTSTRHSFGSLLSSLIGQPAGSLAKEPRRLPLAPVFPVKDCKHPIASYVLESSRSGRTIPIFYQGGSNPGLLRRFTPDGLFRYRPGGPIHVRGHCELRKTHRTLRLDRIRLA